MARRGAHAFWGALAALLWLGCGGGKPGGEAAGVVVRQVLRGEEASQTEAAPAAAASSTLVQAVAPSGSTLVADTPQAIYRKALEQARRANDGASVKQRLGAIESQIDHEQEEEP